MSEHFNHPSYKLEKSGEVRADFHLESEHVGTVQEGRRLVEARRQIEQAQAKEVRITEVTERDIALSIGRGLRIARQQKTGMNDADQNPELAGAK